MRRVGAIAISAALVVAGLAACGGGGDSTTARTPRCGPADLAVTHNGLGGGALSTYGTTFTAVNISEHACTTSGFPKLVALGLDGRPIGGPAKDGTSRKESVPGPVTIAPNYAARFRATWAENV
ncbi:MAG TPA: DUF4232 domain-containing protein, partial [Solirubrobacterales bacterium]|nr:DUF4232 domain-containing protein [Solirubrobacterales bacterium]